MSEPLNQIYGALHNIVLPQLNAIETRQAEQRRETERLNCNLEAFRAEIHIHFAEIRAEIALCRQELEDTMVTLCENEPAGSSDARPIKSGRIVH